MSGMTDADDVRAMSDADLIYALSKQNTALLAERDALRVDAAKLQEGILGEQLVMPDSEYRRGFNAGIRAASDFVYRAIATTQEQRE